MVSIEAAYRRNVWRTEPAKRELPVRGPAQAEARTAPTVSRDVALLASHLADNPVFAEVLETLEKAAIVGLTSSPLGKPGEEHREQARYELEAVKRIRSRIGAMGAELSLHEAPEEPDFS